jgi:hypothetical protein
MSFSFFEVSDLVDLKYWDCLTLLFSYALWLISSLLLSSSPDVNRFRKEEASCFLTDVFSRNFGNGLNFFKSLKEAISPGRVSEDNIALDIIVEDPGWVNKRFYEVVPAVEVKKIGASFRRAVSIQDVVSLVSEIDKCSDTPSGFKE